MAKKYIDADELIKEFKLLKCENKGNLKRDRIYERTVNQVLNELCPQIVEKQPTSDVQPVVHAKWELNNNTQINRCSECECRFGLYPYIVNLYNYCPHCGAKMDGK